MRPGLNPLSLAVLCCLAIPFSVSTEKKKTIEAKETKKNKLEKKVSEKLIVCSTSAYDRAVPPRDFPLSSVLVRLGVLLNDESFTKWAEGVLKEYTSILSKSTFFYRDNSERSLY